MKMLLFLFLGFILFLGSCEKNSSIRFGERYPMKYMSPDFCCANLLLLDGAQVSRENNSYQSGTLAAVNFQPFVDRLKLISEDTVWVEFIFTEEPFQCMNPCGGLDGIPIEVLQVEAYE